MHRAMSIVNIFVSVEMMTGFVMYEVVNVYQENKRKQVIEDWERRI
jgi:hypothetical protein